MSILKPVSQHTEPTLEEMNEWAMKSCPRWNKNKLRRRAYRKAYREAAEHYWETSPVSQMLHAAYESGECVDTYPWPYRDPDFANWEEDDSDDGYSLISDQSGCVIKYATSYCAWKIFEATGTWPQKTSSERLDAKRWVQFLAEAGYTEIVGVPQNGHRYIGIKPDEGEWGLVVWFESDDNSAKYLKDYQGVDTSEAPMIFVSSYVDKKHKAWRVKPEDFTWVKIK